MFYEWMKNRPCIDTLIKIARDANTPQATKSMILWVTSTLSTTMSVDTLKYYQDLPDFKWYGTLTPSLLKKHILDSNDNNFINPK